MKNERHYGVLGRLMKEEIRSRGLYLLFLLLICCFFVAGSSVPVLAQAEQSASAQNVRVGVFEMKGFYEIDDAGNFSGYGIDYLNKIAEKTGWQYEYVQAENWQDCEELLRRNEVDIIAPAEKTQERMEEFDFENYSIGMECGALLTRDTNDLLVYDDFEAFHNIKVGCVEQVIFMDAFLRYAQNNGFTPKLRYYKDTKAVMQALEEGEIDAVMVNLFVKTKNTKVLAKFGAAPIYFMVSSEKPWLLQELNDAQQHIKMEYPTFVNELVQKYYPDFNHVPYTKAELAYIASAPVFVIGCRSDIRPISFVNEETGEIDGITRDILDEVSRMSGLEFRYTALPGGNISYDYLQKNKIQLISSVEYNEKNVHAPGIRLTTPYLKSKKVFVCDRDTHFDSGDSLRIAVSTGSQTLIPAIRQAYPTFDVINYDSAEKCFEAVKKGKVDALLQNQYVVDSWLAKPAYANMVLVPSESLTDSLCLSPVLLAQQGTPDSLLADDRLVSILDKTIRQLDDRETTKIVIEQTTEHQYRYTISDFVYQYRFAIAVVGVILLILGGILVYTVHVRRESMRIVMKNEEKLSQITNNINGGVVVLAGSKNWSITFANEGFLKLLQYGADEFKQFKNQELEKFVHPDDRKEFTDVLNIGMLQGRQISTKLRIGCKDGSYIPTLFNGTLTGLASDSLELYCVIMDISDQENLLSSLFLEQEKYDTLIKNSGEILFEVDCKQKRLSVSPLFLQKFGWQIADVNSRGEMYNLLRHFRIHKDDCLRMEASIRQAFNNKQNALCTVRVPKEDDSYRWCQISMYPMQDIKGNLVYILGKLLDVNDEVNTRRKLEEKSRTDALTGLLNKTAFLEEAEAYLDSGNVENTALIFIDVDNFKQVNDILGHLEGDRAIMETAKKLQIVFSHYDILARFGGDEFCILMKEIPLETLKDKLGFAVEKLRGSFTDGGKTVTCTASIGAVCCGGRGRDLDILLQYADKAVYQAKENGKDQFVLYDGENQ